MSKTTTIRQLIDKIPPSAERYLLRILQERVGRDKALSRSGLLALVQRMPGCSKLSDRQMRQVINGLRIAGQLICAAAGDEGGYYLAATWEELDEYLQREVHSRAMDLLEQEKALRQAGERQWGAYSRQFKLEI